jgi:hypothetical protein
MPRWTLTDEERFLQKVNKTDTCWLWTGAKHNFGYGCFFYEGKNLKAHQYAYIKYIGEIPEGQLIRHKCDIPACCNPAHLEIGTQADNIRDCIERGRYKACSFKPGDMAGENNTKAVLTWEIVRQIRADFAVGDISRKELAIKYNIKHQHCIDILSGKIWKE